MIAYHSHRAGSKAIRMSKKYSELLEYRKRRVAREMSRNSELSEQGERARGAARVREQSNANQRAKKREPAIRAG